MTRASLLAAVAAGALLLPAAGAVAKKPESAKGGAKVEGVSKAKGKARAKKVKRYAYTVSGVYQGAGSVLVKKGNAFARKARLRGRTLTFDFATAKITVADVDGSGVAGIEDVQVGDRVLVHFRAPRTLGEDATFKAHKLVDQTRPEDADESEEGEETAPEPPEAELPETDPVETQPGE